VCAKKIITITTATSPPRSTMMCRACDRRERRNTGVPPTNVSEAGYCDVCAKKIIATATATSAPRSTMMCRACDLLLGPATATGQDRATRSN